MLIEDLDYDLPPDRIATTPAEPRDAARLMVIHRDARRVEHRRVRDLPHLAGVLRPGDLLVFNQTKVLPARFAAVRAATGGQVQGLYLQSPDTRRWRVMLESRGRLRPGETIRLEGPPGTGSIPGGPRGTPSGPPGMVPVPLSGRSGDSFLELIEPTGGGEWLAELHSPLDTLTLLARIGSTPLPPYIRKQRRHLHQPEVQAGDAQRYNTVYAQDPGSVAAPTAGLHFTPALLDELDRMGVERAMLTLHVGLGTFAPIRSQQVEDHPIHSEWFHVPGETLAALAATRARGGRIIPVGTTTVRALESLPAIGLPRLPGAPGSEPDEGPSLPLLPGHTSITSLFITPPAAGRPPFTFRFTDALLTNFHLPRSTLLALVAALPGVGLDQLKSWYREAVQEGYRFYSYGDAMLIV